jgi:hypothetical protein
MRSITKRRIELTVTPCPKDHSLGSELEIIHNMCYGIYRSIRKCIIASTFSLGPNQGTHIIIHLLGSSKKQEEP